MATMLFNSDQDVPRDLLTNFSYSLRSEPVDYTQIAKDSMEALTPVVAKGWAISLNLEGLKKKDARYIKIGSEVHTYEDLLNRFQLVNRTKGYSSGVVEKRIDTGKKALTVGRLARAFARVTITYLQRNNAANHFPASMAPDLPTHFRFLNAPYGMTDVELKEHAQALFNFYSKWDALIESAYLKSYIKTESPLSSRRSWEEDFKNYLQFRGMVVETS